MHNFAPGVNIEDFSARYETVFTPKEAGEYVANVEGCGDFSLYIDGERKTKHHTWRTTPTRTVIQAEAGKSYQIEVRFAFVKTWGANMKINILYEPVTDGIQSVGVESSAKFQNAIYNMAGQRVSKNFKGLVIKNGKKVVVK